MFLTYTDNDNQTVKILAAEIAMLQSQRMMVCTGGEDTAYAEMLGTRITLRSGREVWVNMHIDVVEADIHGREDAARMASPAHTAFEGKIRGTGK